MPGKKPLADEAGVLKSACASIQTMPQRPPPRPATTPIAASHDPASTIGSRAVLIADRTATRTPWLTAGVAAASLAVNHGVRVAVRWVAVTPLPASRLWAPARAYRPGAAATGCAASPAMNGTYSSETSVSAPPLAHTPSLIGD